MRRTAIIPETPEICQSVTRKVPCGSALLHGWAEVATVTGEALFFRNLLPPPAAVCAKSHTARAGARPLSALVDFVNDIADQTSTFCRGTYRTIAAGAFQLGKGGCGRFRLGATLSFAPSKTREAAVPARLEERQTGGSG
jgi:hypothetical protein